MLDLAGQRLAKNAVYRAPFSLAFLTDQTRLRDPLIVARAMPRGSAVILRDYAKSRREALARQLLSICQAHGVHLLIGADVELATRIGANGVHWPSWSSPRAISGMITTAACHDEAELKRARAAGVDGVFLSPVFDSGSHPGQGALGPTQFQHLAQVAQLPVLALGGVTADNARQIANRNICGIGAIGAFSATA